MPEHYDLILLSHHKCATNWIRSICSILEEAGIISTTTVRGEDKGRSISQKDGSARVLINVNASRKTTQDIDFFAQPVVHIVRDPRDALVSNYWSWLKSHKNNGEVIEKFRNTATGASTEDGMIILLDYFPMGQQLSSWTDEMWDNSIRFRYEDMLSNLGFTLRKMFSQANIDIPDSVLEEVIERTNFSKMAKGRKPGEEDRGHHYRKGISGDWVNYATPELDRLFNEKYGILLKRLGYW